MLDLILDFWRVRGVRGVGGVGGVSGVGIGAIVGDLFQDTTLLLGGSLIFPAFSAAGLSRLVEFGCFCFLVYLGGGGLVIRGWLCVLVLDCTVLYP